MKTQTNTAKHTPTPWRVNYAGEILGKQSGCSSPIVAKMPVWFTHAKPGHASQDLFAANAEFICQAVNQHDQLIAQRDALRDALETAFATMKHMDGLVESRWESACNQIKSALTL